MTRLNLLRAANLALLILFPISWFMPLLRTGLLRPWRIPQPDRIPWYDKIPLADKIQWPDKTLFELETVTIVSGLQSLWKTAPGLALIVTAAAIFLPMLKTIGITLVQFDLMSPRLTPVLSWLGRFAMADVFLLALYVVLFRGMGLGQIEVVWGLYLFTFCVLASILISALTPHAARQPSSV